MLHEVSQEEDLHFRALAPLKADSVKDGEVTRPGPKETASSKRNSFFGSRSCKGDRNFCTKTDPERDDSEFLTSGLGGQGVWDEDVLSQDCHIWVLHTEGNRDCSSQDDTDN